MANDSALPRPVRPPAASFANRPQALGTDPDKDMKSTYAGGHDKAAIAVFQGDCDAGVAFMDILTISQPTSSASSLIWRKRSKSLRLAIVSRMTACSS